MTSPVPQRKRRLSREDWIGGALEAIAHGGLAAVAVEPLAARLGVTKGSFYSHFSTREELIDAALQSWEHSHGHAELDSFAAIDDPAERLQQLLLRAVTFSQSGALSVHVGLLGELADERVAGVLARVNGSRIRLLTRTYTELGFSRERAGDRARLAYAAYLGLLQMAHEAPERQLSEHDISRFMTEVNSVLIDRP
jgi:AcrR family transcriptional regulator